MTALFDIVYHMRASRDRLSATEQKIADAILDDIAFAASASIDQLALKAAVSIATISRFAKAVKAPGPRHKAWPPVRAARHWHRAGARVHSC